MENIEESKLTLTVARLVKMGLLQSEALMKLSTAMMRIEGISSDVHDEAYEVFTGIQEQLDLLIQIQEMEIFNDI